MEHLLFKEGNKSKMLEEKEMKALKVYHNPIFIKHHQQGFQMEATELEMARAQIMELRAELELERKLRKKVESLAKRMARELAEERRRAESAQWLCGELEIRVCHHMGEIERIEREMEEERRMLRVADIIREERVHMKLEDAKLFYEEKMVKIEQGGECRKRVKVEEGVCKAENPHIKRGIKGFVEFPRGVRSVGSSRNGCDRNYKIECQKAQLKILLKQKSLVQPTSLAIS